MQWGGILATILVGSVFAVAGCCQQQVSTASTTGTESSSAGGSTGGSISAGASSTGGTSGGSSTTGGTTGTSLEDGGCNLDITSQQWEPCDPPNLCGCPYRCVLDPLGSVISHSNSPSGWVCEHECRTNSDCDSTLSGCVDGVCGSVSCGGASENGVYDSTCAVGGIPDSGTCILALVQFQGVDAGACLQAGTSGPTCNPSVFSRSELNEVCAPGFTCVGTSVDGGFCDQLCDDTTVNCPAGQACQTFESVPQVGLCVDAGA